MQRYKNFLVSDIFLPTRGKSLYTRSYAELNPGVYPVYSASLTAPLCYINTYDYEGSYLSWTTNGYGGRIQIISGKFSINADRGLLIPKGDLSSCLYYIKYILEPILVNQAVGRIVDGKKNEYTKVSPKIVSNSIINLPATSSNNIDLEEIYNKDKKIQNIEGFQDKIQKCQQKISTSEIKLECEDSFVALSLGDETYFSLSIGERILKKDSHIHGHGITAYSANVSMPFAYVNTSNLSNFEQDSLIWGIDGIFDWNRIPKGVKFATTDHCGRLQIKSEMLDAEYAFYFLQATKLEYGFDRVFRANLEHIRRLVYLKVPVTESGQFNLLKQKEIAKKYRELNELKRKTSQALDSLCKIKIEIAA